MAALVVLGLGACTTMPVREGPTAKLLPGIKVPRNRENIKITIHEVPLTAWGKCLEVVSRADPMMAIMSVVTLSPLHACARVAQDKDLAPGQQPWCEVAVPEGDEEALEHELRHCEGWDHPRHVHDEYHRHDDPEIAARHP